MQISAAGRALRLPTDKNIIRDFRFTFVTDIHESEDTNYVRCLSRSFRVDDILWMVFMNFYLMS